MIRVIFGILLVVLALSLSAPFGALVATAGVILAGSAWSGRRVAL